MRRAVLIVTLLFACAISAEESPSVEKRVASFLAGEFRWSVGSPLFGAARREADPCVAFKDPSIVYCEKRWHVFGTIRSEKRSHQIEYLSFADWKDAASAERHVLKCSDAYFCAPQVFYFTPHKKWYLLYQAADKERNIAYGPAISTSDNVANPNSWTKPEWLYAEKPKNLKGWIDFWIICDAERAHLFFTSNDGNMWRAETKLADFPKNFGEPKLVLKDDIFEASHTYALKGLNKYLSIIEAQNGARRYYKAYLADTLDGEWKPLAATKEKPFAAISNVSDAAEHWTDSVSHGELIREGVDEKMTVDPANIRFLFQGVLSKDMAGKKYGEIPWRIGILESQ
jgi:hypothetical protein